MPAPLIGLAAATAARAAARAISGAAGKKVVSGLEGKQSAAKYAAAKAAANAKAKSLAAAKLKTAKLDKAAARRAQENAKALKAAKGPSLAPKGYITDAQRRDALNKIRAIEKKFGLNSASVSKTGAEAIKTVKNPAPKNIISKSGKKANTPKLNKKAK